ncbi:BAG family molecular chaperone regulator 7 [Glycine soja]|uniref:BAG family molecular chaperone regulator 7 n=1 Tax=Glycine soja TaxID=3848 RepID=A0A0B2RKF8_GLYSO|nr:BAG family molecular chaperone regulator 7 [Glycine soja]
MSRFRRFELIEQPPFFPSCYSSPFLVQDSLSLDLDLDLLPFPSPFDAFADLLHAPSLAYRRLEGQLDNELRLQSLSDRVAELESRFHRVLGGERKYTEIAEEEEKKKKKMKKQVKVPKDRNVTWDAEEEEENKKRLLKGVAKNVKWTAEITGKGEKSGSSRKYTFQVQSGDAEKKKEKEKEKEKKKGNGSRIVEIHEPSGHRDVVLRQAFAKRFGAVQNERGKKKDLSPQDAALLIQISFRAYLIRRSKALRALRELAIAKSKLKEIRAQFNNFSYRRHVACNAEERQRFSEKIIVLLLTVDAIEGADIMVRSAKRSMVDELEAMLDVVDPQPGGRSASLSSFKRRTFDMPDGVIRKEIEEGVAQVVQMLEEAENSSEA